MLLLPSSDGKRIRLQNNTKKTIKKGGGEFFVKQNDTSQVKSANFTRTRGGGEYKNSGGFSPRECEDSRRRQDTTGSIIPCRRGYEFWFSIRKVLSLRYLENFSGGEGGIATGVAEGGRLRGW